MANRQLTWWGLDDLLFTTGLIVSELVTNTSTTSYVIGKRGTTPRSPSL
jgi:hypothetical protein